MRRLSLRIAYKLRLLPVELIIFHDLAAARAAGFRGRSHPDHPHIHAWWPGLGAQGLMSRTFQRVTVHSDMLRREIPDYGRLEHLLRHRQHAWGDKAIWIEL